MNSSDSLINICTGSEWYYFPSHFFLPGNVKLQFIRDGFHGQLPKHFQPFNGTYSFPSSPFNDQNVEDESAYVDVSSCNFLIKLEKSPENSNLTVDEYEFEEILHELVIDPIKSSSPLFRAFYVPLLSKNVFRKYSLYRKIQVKSK